MKNMLAKTKFFIVLVLFSVVSVATHAQTGYLTKSVSIQVGLSLSKITTDRVDPSYNPSYRGGFNTRVSISLPISDRMGAQLGLGWMQRGYSVDIVRSAETLLPENSPDGIYIRSRVDYLSIPALLQFYPTSSNVIHVLAGPVLSFALGCSLELETELHGFVAERYSSDCTDGGTEIETVDISIMTGVGVNIPVSSEFSVSLDAVYDLGMIDTTTGIESKNRGFAITAGVSLPLGK
ncbi:MAG: PorT family protein [Rhodothermaceae bacterium]|nr:PorT family protein [Rhodothermaceae bacterium]MXZ58668.1 PorT family protein [Rhodothermaceae bacterium]MYH12822.1 PorT family protein [Rhodothermaceae bacterium]MYJ06899.1 PorT family protein [Rhodothermaceae bacterium]MYJ49964.1 PorT family protein [Rhodothermaceae bacterium]